MTRVPAAAARGSPGDRQDHPGPVECLCAMGRPTLGSMCTWCRARAPEVAAMRGFRDALRADPALRHSYAALKRAIVVSRPVDPVTFTRSSTTGSPRPWAGSACRAAPPLRRGASRDRSRQRLMTRGATPLARYRCVPQRLEPAAPGYRDVGTELKRTFRNLSGWLWGHLEALERLAAHDRVSRHTTSMPTLPGATGPCGRVRRSISVNPSRRGIPPLAMLA